MGLCNNQAVEGIFVVRWQHAESINVARLDQQDLDVIHNLLFLHNAFERLRQHYFANLMLYL